MKTLKFYEITKEDYENTNYRPLGVEIDDIETEDGWNYGDIIQNSGDGYVPELLFEANDIIVWKVISLDEWINGRDDNVNPDKYFEEYTVEIK